MRPLALYASGMVTAVGLDAPSTCAAVRAAVAGAVETHFVDRGGERLLGCPVPLGTTATGIERLAQMAASAISECLLAAKPARAEEIPLFLGLPEKDRPGRREDLETRLPALIGALLKTKLHPGSASFPSGKTAVLHGLAEAERLICDGRAPYCIVAGVDSLLSAPALRAYESANRLLTSINSDGFIPGEGASAILVGPLPKSGTPILTCRGASRTLEKAVVGSEEPLRAEGLTEAVRLALEDAKETFDAVDYRIADLSGEQYGFKEAALAIGRAMRTLKREFALWHPADCLGEMGAASGPCVLGIALAASRKGYAPGPGVLCHFAGDGGERGAVILSTKGGSHG